MIIFYFQSPKYSTATTLRTNFTWALKLTNDKANYFDIADGWVYRGNASDDLTMYKMRTDGSERTLLSSDKGMFLSMAGDWIYYVSFQDKSKRDTTRIRADGTGKAVVQ